MNKYRIPAFLVFLTALCVAPAQAQFMDMLKNKTKDAAKKIGIEKTQDVVGINLPCKAAGNTDYLTYCLQQSLSSAIVNDFAGMLSGDDVETHQSSVLDAIYKGEDQSWENPETGASGQATVTKEKTKTKKTEVVVLKDKVETVPPLDLIGENYTAKSGTNVRGGPGTDYKVVGQLLNSEVVNVVGQVQNSDWFMISQGGVGSGFVLESSPKAVATNTAQPAGDLAEVKTDATQTCKTIEQTVVLEDGEEKTEKIKACQGPNGWEIA